MEIPVAYEDVDRIVPRIHTDRYDMIIHLGVGKNGFMTLEKVACGGGYYKKDIHGKTGPLEGREIYVTRLDVAGLVYQLHSLGTKVSSALIERS